MLGEHELPSWDKIRELRAKLTDQQQAVIDILVKVSDQYELQEDLQNEGLVSEEIETINKEFKGVMEQADRYISESEEDTLSTISHQSSKRNQLSWKEYLTQEHVRRITKEVKQKQMKLINAQKELEDKYKSERAQLEQEFADQRRILEETNNNIQKCYNWVESEIVNEFEEDNSEQTSVSNDGTIHRKLSADAPPFHPLNTKNKVIKIDKKTEKIGRDLWKQMKHLYISIFYGDKKYMRIGKQPLQSAKIKHLQKKSTGYCSYTNISLERHLKLLKVLYILCLPTKQPKKD